MATVQRYIFFIDDLGTPAGNPTSFRSRAESPESFAEQLQDALREPALWQRWRAMQPHPDAIDLRWA